MAAPEYTNLKITGDISVEPVTQKLPDDAFAYCLMGPTGAGKSCFIQALAGDAQDLGISKDQLSGFTQTASAYRLINVFFEDEGKDRPIFLVDTPGFSDPKISYQGVFQAVGDLYREIINGKNYLQTLFLTPVTDTRMPGTKRRTIKMLTAMYDPSKYRVALTIVTTMWNTLYTEHARHRAEENHAQIRDDIWKGFSDMGATTVRFTNTRESALEILDTRSWKSNGVVNFVAMWAFLYTDLHERIATALQQKEIIASELAHPQAQTNLELRGILNKNHRENEETLKKFIEEFLDLDSPPAGFEDAHYRLLKSLLGTYIPNTMSIRIFVLQYHLTRLVHNAKRRGSKWFKPKA